MSLFLGHTSNNQEVNVPLEQFLRHFLCLGSSGSGKTVAGKIVCEEFLKQGLPVIAMDPQGDIASMILRAEGLNEEEKKKQEEFFESIDILIWTPGRELGIPLCLNPLDLSNLPESPTQKTLAISSLANNLSSLMGYPPENKDCSLVSAFFDLLLQYLVEKGEVFQSMKAFSLFCMQLPKELQTELSMVIDEKRQVEVVRKLATFGVGAKKLLFNTGFPLRIENFVGDKSQKPRLSIVQLNCLQSNEEKEFFVSQLTQSLYEWMLSNPSSEPQLLFYLDEIAPFFPPVRKPTCKENLSLLFKQARKFGICCLIASQNPGDIDYKGLGQFSTWLVGRLLTQQDCKRIEPFLRSESKTDALQIMEEIPTLSPGEFFLLNPDKENPPYKISMRSLFSKHETLDETRLEEAITSSIRSRWNHLFASPSSASVSVSNPKMEAEEVSVSVPKIEAEEISELPVVQKKKSSPEDFRIVSKGEIELLPDAPSSQEELQWALKASLQEEEDLEVQKLSAKLDLHKKISNADTMLDQINQSKSLSAGALVVQSPLVVQERLQIAETSDSIETSLEHPMILPTTLFKTAPKDNEVKVLRGKDVVLDFFERYPGAYSVQEISKEVDLTIATLRNHLKTLEDSNDASQKVHSSRVGRSLVYWLAKDGFVPGESIVRPILAMPFQPQVEKEYVHSLARNTCEKTLLFFSKEIVSVPQPRYLLFWRIRLKNSATDKGLLQSLGQWFGSKKEEGSSLFFHADSGALLKPDRRQMQFIEQIDDEEISLENEIPWNVPWVPQTPSQLFLNPQDFSTLKTPSEVWNSWRNYFDEDRLISSCLFPGQLVAIPYWEVQISHKKKKSIRYIRVDGIMGSVFELPME